MGFYMIDTNLKDYPTTKRVQEHLDEALKYFPAERIVYISLYGSQNYGLDTPTSDIDTKLVVTPTLNDIIFNKPPISTTHVRANDEHIDFKDIRLMLQIYRKQNANYIETLFTPYMLINEDYARYVEWLVSHNEQIARFNPYQAIATMQGMAHEKYHALEKLYPSRKEIVEKYGYDPKQLCHIIRLHNMMEKYIKGETYTKCLRPDPDFANFLKTIKSGAYSKEVAEALADFYIYEIEDLYSKYKSSHSAEENKEAAKILDDVQSGVMKLAIQKEFD